MKSLTLALASLLALPFPVVASQPAVQAGQLEALVAQHAQRGQFSGSVLVARHGTVVFSAAHGEANRDHRIPNRLDTRHNIGSIGKLRLDDTLAMHLPDYPFPEKATITLQHLLNHSSGLGDYMEHADYKGRMAGIRGIADILPLIHADRPQFPAGERFAYSNSGMVLLGAIIEKASGLSYPDYLQRHIFGPAGMQDSHLAQEDEVLANRAIGYTELPDGGYRANLREIMPASSDGGLRTTAPDLLRFDRAINNDSLLGAATRQRMLTPVGPVPFLASGWFTMRVHGHLAVGHGGGAPGVNAEFRRYPDDDITVIVLANHDLGATPLAEAIETVLFGPSAALPSTERAAPGT